MVLLNNPKLVSHYLPLAQSVVECINVSKDSKKTYVESLQQEWPSGHPITMIKKNKTEKGMVDIHGIISFF